MMSSITSQSSPLIAKIKHHARYTNMLICTFRIWDENKDQLILRNMKQHSIVRYGLILQFLGILLQLYCTRMKAANYLETVEGLGLTSLFLAGWLARAEFYPDLDQIPLLNFICWLNNITHQNSD